MDDAFVNINIPDTWKLVGKASWKGSEGRLYEAVKNVFIRVFFDTVTERWGATMRDNRQREAKYTALFWNKRTDMINELLLNEISGLTELEEVTE